MTVLAAEPQISTPFLVPPSPITANPRSRSVRGKRGRVVGISSSERLQGSDSNSYIEADDRQTKMASEGNIVKGTMFCLFVLTFALFVTGLVASSLCYTSPCFDGDGLFNLWGVHGGRGFEVAWTSTIALLHCLALAWYLFKMPYSPHRYGMMLGSLVVMPILLFFQAVAWGSISSALRQVDDSSNFYEHSDRCWGNTSEYSCNIAEGCEWVYNGIRETGTCMTTLKISKSAQKAAGAVTALSVICVMLEASVFGLLKTWHQKFSDSSMEISIQDPSYLPPPSLASAAASEPSFKMPSVESTMPTTTTPAVAIGGSEEETTQDV